MNICILCILVMCLCWFIRAKGLLGKITVHYGMQVDHHSGLLLKALNTEQYNLPGEVTPVAGGDWVYTDLEK